MAGTCDLLRSKKRIFLAKKETTEGVDAAPTPALNAILVNSVEFQPQPNLLAANELTGKLDAGEFDVGGFPIQIPIKVNFKPGPDAATAPEAGVLLEACAMKKVANAEIQGTATGGTTKTVTVNRSIDTDFPAADGALVGQPIVIGFVTPIVTLCTSYVVSGSTATIGLAKALAAAPVAEDVTVPVNITYVPSEDCPPTLTCYIYEDGLLKKVLGCRGNAEWSLDKGGRPELTITLTGLFGGKEDDDLPEDTRVYQDVRPGIWRGGIMAIDGDRAAVEQLTVNLNNQTPYPGDPNEPEGFLPPIITGREVQGTINPLDTLVATRDIFTDFRNGVKRAVAALVPNAANALDGHYTGFVFPSAKYRDEGPADRDGLQAVTAPFSALNDSGAHPEKGEFGFYASVFYGPASS